MAIGRLTQLATAISTTSDLSVSATIPSGGQVAAGDLLLVLCAMPSGSRTFVISGGSGTWTSLGSAVVSGHTSQLWWKTCAAGDLGASITVTHQGGVNGMRQLLAIGKMSGVSSATPFGSPVAKAGTATSTQSTTKTTPSVASVAATSREIGVVVDTRGASTPNTTAWTAPSGFTKQGDLYTTSSTGLSLAWGDADTTGSGTFGSRAWTANQSALGSMWTLGALEGASTPPPTLTRQLVGAPTETGFTVAAKVSDVATGVRLAVSTASNMASPTYFGPTTPAAGGYVKLSATGLTAGTAYWYALELDGTLGARTGQARTLPTAGSAASFGFAAASCALTGSEHAVFDAIRTRVGADSKSALFFAHLGDLQYVNGGGGVAASDEATLTSEAEQALASAKQRALYEAIPVSYTWSDLDWGGSNSDGTWAGAATQQTVYRKLWPHPALPATGIYRTWVVGRVRFIQTDSRSFMSAKGAVDNASKTMLGATQKQWLKDQLVTAQPFKVWLHDNAWVGTPSNPGNDDRWRAFSTERAEIAAYITANATAVGKLLYVHGDTHSLAADNGTNNPYGGFPFVCCAPMDQSASVWDLSTLTGGSWPGDTSSTHVYGWFDVTDNGDQITVAFTGYDSSGTARITQTVVADTTQTISPAGIGPGIAFGAPIAVPGSVTVMAAGIAPSTAIGAAQAIPGVLTVQAAGIPPATAIGVAVAAPGSLAVQVVGIASTASIGAAHATPADLDITIGSPQGRWKVASPKR